MRVMSNAANQDAGPDFSIFKNIPPGFAGTIIDWSMGSREITATIIDLILRNHLSVIDTKIIVNTRKYPTKNFEKKFINTIFGENEYVNFKQLSTIVYKKEFDTLLKILADGMIEEGFINKNFQDKMADVAKELIEKIPFGMFNKMKELSKELPDKNTRAIIIPGWAWKAICIFLGVLLCISFIIPHIGALLFPLWFVLIPFAIFTWYINSKIKKKLDPSYDWVLTETGKKRKTTVFI